MGRSVVQDFKSSLQHNGTTSKTNVPNHASISPTTAFTLAAWVKPATLSTDARLIDKNFTLTLRLDGKLRCTIPGVVDIEAGTQVERVRVGRWQHVAIVRNATNVYDYYIDGAKVATTTDTNIPGTNAPLILGGNSGAFLNGLMSNVLISSTAYTPEEVLSLYATGKLSGTTGGFWKLDEGAGTTATDSSGNGNNGTITGATYSSDVPSRTRTTAQDFKSSLSLIGSSGSRVQIAKTAALNFGTGDFTYTVWCKVRTAGNQRIIYAYSTNTTKGWYLGYPNTAGVPVVTMFGTGATNATATRSIADNNWHHLAVIRSGTVITLYIDGSVSATGAINDNLDGTSSLYYGSDLGNASNFNGSIVDATIYNRALSASEVLSMYTSGNVPATGLVARYFMQEGAGTTAIDNVTANHGTITSATYSADTPTKVRQTVGANLVRNGDFEYAPPFTAATRNNGGWIDGTSTGSTTNSIFGWGTDTGFSTGNAQYDTATKYSGTASLRIRTAAAGEYLNANTVGKRTPLVADLQSFAIKIAPNTSYTCTFRMKTNAVSGDSNHGAFLATIQYNGQATAIITANSDFIKTTTDWTQYAVTFTTQSTVRYIDIQPTIYGHTGTGTLIMDAWFDDITLRETVPVGRGVVQDYKASLAFNGAANVAVPITLPTTGTVAVWVKPTAFFNFGTIWDTSGNSNLWECWIYATGNVVARTGSTGLIGNNGQHTPLGQWSHVAVTWVDGGTAKLFVNGSEKASIAHTAGTSGTTFWWGGGNGGNSAGKEYLADGMIFSQALTGTELSSLYSNGVVPYTPLVRHKMNEGAGTTAFDTSGNNNHGTITSATYSADVPSKKRQVVGENMVRNGDMEYIPPFTAPTSIQTQWVSGDSSRVGGGFPGFGWAIPTAGVGVGGTVSFDTTVSKTGTASLKLDITNTTGAITAANFVTAGGLTREQARDSGMPIIQPNTSYTLTAWIKTLNVPASGAYLDLRQINSDGTTATTNSSTRLSGTNDWTFVTITVVTQPAARYACILPRNNISGNVCTAWFDDIVLTPTVQ